MDTRETNESGGGAQPPEILIHRQSGRCYRLAPRQGGLDRAANTAITTYVYDTGASLLRKGAARGAHGSRTGHGEPRAEPGVTAGPAADCSYRLATDITTITIERPPPDRFVLEDAGGRQFDVETWIRVAYIHVVWARAVGRLYRLIPAAEDAESVGTDWEPRAGGRRE